MSMACTNVNDGAPEPVMFSTRHSALDVEPIYIQNETLTNSTRIWCAKVALASDAVAIDISPNSPPTPFSP